MISPMHPITQNNHRGRMYRLTLIAALLVTACAPTQGAVVDADHTPGWTTTTFRCAPKPLTDAPPRCSTAPARTDSNSLTAPPPGGTQSPKGTTTNAL